jgi:hypothetical protein
MKGKVRVILITLCLCGVGSPAQPGWWQKGLELRPPERSFLTCSNLLDPKCQMTPEPRPPEKKPEKKKDDGTEKSPVDSTSGNRAAPDTKSGR